MRQKSSGNALLQSLKSAKGNQRVILLSEPLFGVLYYMYMPLAAVYMAACGLNPLQIGTLATVNLLSQMMASAVSGAFADKWGRRKTLIIFDMIAWCTPLLIWSFWTSYTGFLVAAVLNGWWRPSNIGYSMLLSEDTDPNNLVHYYSLTNIAAMMAGFFAPLSFILVKRFDTVPAVRGIYLTMFCTMAFKAWIIYGFCYDTQVAKEKMAEFKNIPIRRIVFSSGKLLKTMFRSAKIMQAVGIMACYTIMKNITDNFWPLYVTGLVGQSNEQLSLFSTLKTLITLLSTLIFLPKVRIDRFHYPAVTALLIYIMVNITYVLLPVLGLPLIVLGSALEGFSMSILIPLTTSILLTTLPDDNRAQLLSLSYTICLFVSSPMGVFAGKLSSINLSWPLILAAGIAALAVVLAVKLHNNLYPERSYS